MALLFQRLARNYIKNGYFPTDSDTTQRILNAVSPAQQGAMRIIDPCAGEGVALAECKHHLGMEVTEAFGVELNAERASQAKTLLDVCIQGDFQDTVISPRSFGLLWLNPPYGDLVADNAQSGDPKGAGRQRLEKLFYQQSARLLQYGGILVLIVPHTTLDQEFRKWLAAGFERVRVFLAPEQHFKQAVVMGVRRRTDAANPKTKENLAVLEAFCQAAVKPELPVAWDELPFKVPGSQGEVKFQTIRIDAEQLTDEIKKYPCLWGQFQLHFNLTEGAVRRPLMKLSDWHLALALSAGQVSGVVRSNNGQRLLVIKGDTFKRKKTSVEIEERANGETQEIRTELDVFVPTIKALDFTPGSATFGEILTIK